MSKKLPKIALLYDFDKTLSTRDMQEYSFIPNLGMSASEFWGGANDISVNLGMDRILAYMYLMIKKAKAKGVPIRRENFVQLGRDIEFLPGVTTWFERINAFGKEHGAEVQHYIISSGLKEIIEGSKISKEFKKIYACEFHYDENGIADWPLLAVNYTAKTQFPYRINKGVLDISNDADLNNFVPKDDRPVPFRNMIYIGDGLTDVPCMKLVKTNGGKSIAVYTQKHKVADLLRHGRVDYIAPANYCAGSYLDTLIKEVIVQMVSNDLLIRKSKNQVRRLPDVAE
jgi:2-hydroxy-3-keto-5-methylthiopentenyl-1-phosphate phosphatase